MNRTLWLLIDGLLIGIIMAFALTANGQALPTVTPDTNWTAIGIAVACVFLIAGGIWYIRDRPGAVAKAKEETAGVQAGFEAIAHRLSESLHTLTNTHAEAVAAIPVALASTPPGAAAAPAIPIDIATTGKNGAPGTFTIQVTGVPATDMAAINAQYFG